MKVFELTGNSDLAWVNTSIDGDALHLDNASHRGERYVGTNPVALEYSNTDSKVDWLAVDCVRAPAYGTLLVSEKAAMTLGALLEQNGYFLPVELDSVIDYKLFIPCTKIDILDQDKSVIQRFPDGDIRRIIKYQFHVSDDKPMPAIFQLIGKQSTIYANEKFFDCVNRHGLTGFKFKEVWQLHKSATSENMKTITSGIANIPATDNTALFRKRLNKLLGIPFARRPNGQ